MEASIWQTLFNKAARRLSPLSRENLCHDAMRRTGLKQFGPPAPEPALSILVQSLEREANLHPLGRFLMRVHLRELLETRLRLADVWREDWSTLDETAIERPVFILGMPRSGSTFLHELLSEDPSNRSPRVWEVMSPVAGPGEKEKDRQRRIRRAELCLWWFRRLAPQADSVYPMRAATPHECVAIHSYTFLSEEFVSTCRVPSYEKYLRSVDLTPAYAWQKRFLQMLQAGTTPKRWILKSPDHVHGLEELFAIFPDAIIIHTHRNPLPVLKSSIELTKVLHGLYAWRGNPEEIARHETQALAEGAERSIQFRDEHPELADRFVDIRYSDLISDPLAAISQIYQRIESPLTDVASNRMRRLASSRSRYRRRRTGAGPAEMKLGTSAELNPFQHYCSRFGLSYGD